MPKVMPIYLIDAIVACSAILGVLAASYGVGYHIGLHTQAKIEYQALAGALGELGVEKQLCEPDICVEDERGRSHR